MSQEIEKIVYCPKGHSSKDSSYFYRKNSIQDERCSLCTREHFIEEFETWPSGNDEIDEIIRESQIYSIYKKPVALKEIKDPRYDILEFLKVIEPFNNYDEESFASYYGISRNPSTRNYIIVMDLFDCLDNLHSGNLVLCDLHSGNILINYDFEIYFSDRGINLGLCKLQNYWNSNSDVENDNIYGSTPYIPSEVLKGNRKNKFTREGNIYSFGGIMYEIVTAQQPFADQAHDTYLMIDICNGVRPKVPDLILNWIPECRDIETLHELHDLLEEIKSGKSSDPNLLKPNESIILS
ncbi:hypothetical protein Glove_60g79 [Diversispora epigaea]|uniref:Protein kinase domain-containing protein n=1 Tax=Diversispora epigaea TaxID=1348612 RepID=A0A397JML4_9GLOM|nr:hypothetical protein Glove_60g79 [Diversispora epigaea]